MNLSATTNLENLLLEQPALQQGLVWGEVGPGHPEGQVWRHIEEMCLDIALQDYPDWMAEILRFITFLHDSFKYEVQEGLPKLGENHHGWYARRFAEPYVHYFGPLAQDILEILQWHDEPYHIFRNWKKNRRQSQERWQQLLSRPITRWDIFVEFVRIDSRTGDKANSWFDPFEQELKNLNKIE